VAAVVGASVSRWEDKRRAELGLAPVYAPLARA
jgi:hypothetical protein